MRRGAGQPCLNQAPSLQRAHGCAGRSASHEQGIHLPHSPLPPSRAGHDPPLSASAEPSRRAAASTNRQSPREPGPIRTRYSRVLPPPAVSAAARRRHDRFRRAGAQCVGTGGVVFVPRMKPKTADKFLTALKMLSESMKCC